MHIERCIHVYTYTYMDNGNNTARPLYGGGSGVCVDFILFYYFLLPFGVWANFEVLLGPVGQLLDHFGCLVLPRGCLGLPWSIS